MGAFTFSEEDGTPAADYVDQVHVLLVGTQAYIVHIRIAAAGSSALCAVESVCSLKGTVSCRVTVLRCRA